MKLQSALFWFLILFLPTQLGKHFWPQFSFVLGLRVDYLSPTIYLTDLLTIGILLSWFWEKKSKFPISRYWHVIVIFFYLFLISFLAKNSEASFYKFFRLTEFFLLGLYITKNSSWIKNLIAPPLALAIGYQSLVVIAQFVKQSSLGGIFWLLGERNFSAGSPGIALIDFGGRLWLRPYGTFSHPNSLAGFTLVSLILFWCLGKNLPKPLKILTTILGALTIFLAFSRAVWFVAFLTVIILGVRRLLPSKINIKFYWLFFGGLLLSFPAFVKLLGYFSGQAATERLQLTKVALSIIKINPLAGIGLNNFIVYLPQFYEGKVVYLLQPVHNIFLLVAAETGLVGLLLFLWFLFLSYKKLSSGARPLSAGLIIALSTILTIGLFDHYWLSLQQNMLLATLVLGLSFGGTKSNLVKPRLTR